MSVQIVLYARDQCVNGMHAAKRQRLVEFCFVTCCIATHFSEFSTPLACETQHAPNYIYTYDYISYACYCTGCRQCGWGYCREAMHCVCINWQNGVDNCDKRTVWKRNANRCKRCRIETHIIYASWVRSAHIAIIWSLTFSMSSIHANFACQIIAFWTPCYKHCMLVCFVDCA